MQLANGQWPMSNGSWFMGKAICFNGQWNSVCCLALPTLVLSEAAKRPTHVLRTLPPIPRRREKQRKSGKRKANKNKDSRHSGPIKLPKSFSYILFPVSQSNRCLL
ncbi:hypothetical protein ACMFMF_001237 [Clarireedia jacksonii]